MGSGAGCPDGPWLVSRAACTGGEGRGGDHCSAEERDLWCRARRDARSGHLGCFRGSGTQQNKCRRNDSWPAMLVAEEDRQEMGARCPFGTCSRDWTGCCERMACAVSRGEGRPPSDDAPDGPSGVGSDERAPLPSVSHVEASQTAAMSTPFAWSTSGGRPGRVPG